MNAHSTQAAQAQLDAAARNLASAARCAAELAPLLAKGLNVEFQAMRGAVASLLAQAAAAVWSADTHCGCRHAGSCMRCWRHEEISALHTECTDDASFCMQPAALSSTVCRSQDLHSACAALCDDYTQELNKGFLL